MPAHLRSIRHKCNYDNCYLHAVEELYNTRNSPMGKYCAKHAKVMLDALLDKEGRDLSR